MDETVPNISFDESGVCNYCRIHDALDSDNPNDERGKEILAKTFASIRGSRGKSKYDCVIGVSGGTDSTYLLHLAKENGLNPLAVHLDNGWNSEISVSNLYNALKLLNIDLYTHVVDYEEMKDILLSYLKSGLPWADAPTDIAIMSILYRVAAKYGVKYVLVGNNFRTEGKQPDEWTHSDGRQVKAIQKKFGSKKLKTFPNLTLVDFLYFAGLKRIKMFRPFYFIKYDKKEAQTLIKELYQWRDYGGHHHESLYTKFIIGYWLKYKFNIDKRKVTFSALIRNNELSREEALSKVAEPPYDPKLMEEDKLYICKKLGISMDQFQTFFISENKSIFDYPSYYLLMKGYSKYAIGLFRFLLPFRPMMTYENK